MMACRRQAGEVRHLAAGDEPKRAGFGQTKQLLQPATGNLLDDPRTRCREGKTGVLIPRRRQPISSDRRRKTAAEYEAKEASARHTHQASTRVASQLLDHFKPARRSLGKRPPEDRAQLFNRRVRPHGPLLQRLKEVRRDLSRPTQQIPRAHPRNLTPSCSRPSAGASVPTPEPGLSTSWFPGQAVQGSTCGTHPHSSKCWARSRRTPRTSPHTGAQIRRPSKPVRRRNPPLGRFDSSAAPFWAASFL